MLDAFAECLRQGDCRRELPSLQSPLGEMEGAFESIYLREIFKGRQLEAPVRALELMDHYLYIDARRFNFVRDLEPRQTLEYKDQSVQLAIILDTNGIPAHVVNGEGGDCAPVGRRVGLVNYSSNQAPERSSSAANVSLRYRKRRKALHTADKETGYPRP